VSVRLLKLYLGLAAFGAGLALMLRADLGLGPWDVLHQGLADRLGLPIGWVVNGVAAVVMLAWIPLRERPGLGTVSNVVVVGLAADGALRVLPAPDLLVARFGFLALGIAGTAAATGLYVGAGFGPGPRDGLMTGLARRGIPVRVARTAIELGVLVIGLALGGPVGIGTVIFTLTIGPLVQIALHRLAGPPARPDTSPTTRAAAPPAVPPGTAPPSGDRPTAACPQRGSA
jgi:uncharacterized membrane protein YczE